MGEKVISLNGQWRYKTAEKAGFNGTMRVPSNWEKQGLNDYSGVVWFEKKFNVTLSPPEADEGSTRVNTKADPSSRGAGLRMTNKEYIIRFKGVDYFADVWLNGKYLGHHEGYFQPFEFNVTKQINLNGKNTLLVKVNSPKEDLKNWPHEKRYIKGVFGHHDIRPGSWSPKFGQMMGTGGIWNDVELIITGKVRLKAVSAKGGPASGGKVLGELSGLVKIVMEVENRLSSTVVSSAVVQVRENGKREEVSGKRVKVRIKPGKNIIKLDLKVKKPKLWWIWEHGNQDMYEAEVSIEGARGQGLGARDGKKVRFGFRSIEKDKDGNWVLNGRRIFIRGTNIIPEEYLSTYTKDRIAKDIALLKEANVNAVRVHAHVNREELYDALDRAGILVWQDFALQWEYQDTKVFKTQAVKQVKDMVNLLYNHPSIVLFCCHNESIKSKKGADRLMYQAVKAMDPSRLIVLSSDFGEHPYPGWFWGKMENFSLALGGTLPSEFGAMALPNLPTMKKMFKPRDIWPPNWMEWAKRDFTYDQMFHVAKISKGTSIQELIGNSQDYQVKMIKYVIEQYRIKKFVGGAGIFQFMFLEPWPCISFSVLDYYREKKQGFYALKQVFQPVVVIAKLNRETFGAGRVVEGEFWAVNDLEKELSGLKLDIGIFKRGKKVHSFGRAKIGIGKNCCKYITSDVYSSTGGLKIPKRLKPGNYDLVFDVLDMSGSGISSNAYNICIEKVPEGLEEFNAHFVWQ